MSEPYPIQGSSPWDEALKAYIDAGALPADAVNGQGVTFNEGTGLWEPENPVGNSRIAANRNVTGTATALTAASGTNGGVGTTVVIASTSVSAVNSNGRPCVIKAQAGFSQTAVGAVATHLMLYETTDGGNVLRQTFAEAQAGSSAPVTLGTYEWAGLGVVTTTRTFELRARLFTSAAAMSGFITNTDANPTDIRVVAE